MLKFITGMMLLAAATANMAGLIPVSYTDAPLELWLVTLLATALVAFGGDDIGRRLD